MALVTQAPIFNYSAWAHSGITLSLTSFFKMAEGGYLHAPAALTLRKTCYLLPPGNISGTYFCYRMNPPQQRNPNDSIGNQTHGLPACIAVSQPKNKTNAC
jgi:hypothetical protein